MGIAVPIGGNGTALVDAVASARRSGPRTGGRTFPEQASLATELAHVLDPSQAPAPGAGALDRLEDIAPGGDDLAANGATVPGLPRRARGRTESQQAVAARLVASKIALVEAGWLEGLGRGSPAVIAALAVAAVCMVAPSRLGDHLPIGPEPDVRRGGFRGRGGLRRGHRPRSVLRRRTQVGEDHTLPYRVHVDVGCHNQEHRFRAVAYTAAGNRLADAVETPRVVANDEATYDLQQLYVTAVSSRTRCVTSAAASFRSATPANPEARHLRAR